MIIYMSQRKQWDQFPLYNPQVSRLPCCSLRRWLQDFKSSNTSFCFVRGHRGPQVNKQLSLTASMSLTRFCAKHMPNICSNAIPMKMPATTVRLSWSHFSNWGTHPFMYMNVRCSESAFARMSYPHWVLITSSAGSLVQQEKGTPHFSRLGLESVQLK